VFQYREGAIVAIKNDVKPPMYEITFRASDGQDFDLTLSEEEITEVVHDRRLSRQL
jgi:hypothetical protein